MYFTDRGIEELERRRGDEEVTLAWLAEQLQAFVDANPDFETPIERLAVWLALVDESFRSLRLMLLDVWRRAPEYRDFIDGSLPIVAQHVRENRSHYAFI